MKKVRFEAVESEIHADRQYPLSGPLTLPEAAPTGSER